MLERRIKLLEYWTSRLNAVSAVAKFLLGGRFSGVFPLARCSLRRSEGLYSFAVLFRELHADEIEGRTSIRKRL
jgi:hypothetical protein